MYVEVALPLPIFGTFTYRTEDPPPAPGTRVLVPFRRTEHVGWVVAPTEPGGLKGIRPILDRLEKAPSLSNDMLELGRWMSDYYVSPLGVTFRSMLPSVLSDGSREVLTLTERGIASLGSSASSEEGSSRDVRALAAVRHSGGELAVSGLRRILGSRSLWPTIRGLTAEGLLEHRTVPPSLPVKTRNVVRLERWIADLGARDQVFGRARRQRECYELIEASGGAVESAHLTGTEGFSSSVISGLVEKGLVTVQREEVLRDPFEGRVPEPPRDHELSQAQTAAVRALVRGTKAATPPPFLLHGVTGSGKTLVYIHLLREVVDRQGRGAIVLVPEIALTPQTVKRFRAWFGDRVAVLHSGLSDGERFDQWRQIRAGEKPVVVGARSALFAPLPELGAIVVDEEHDGSYKQSEAPRYGARDVAVMRAALSGAVCVLGSATPSLESWRNAERGKFTMLSLPERVGGGSMPSVYVVDLRRDRSGRGDDRRPEILSARLVDAVRERLERGEQSILLLNRRGYASFVQCRSCGQVMECPNCSVSLTFHRRRNHLLCHHCRHEERAPDRCPACGVPDLSFRGLGTEQVERVVAETFPRARIARMDVDTTSGKWAHQEILGRVERGEVDLLLGTQMIAKGLDFPRVTLVGVVNADVGIHLPDFRASERAFQLLSQVAGRAGRGPLGGEVIIQSALPEHHAIQAAVQHDVPGFIAKELADRRSPPYPPHLRLVNVIVSSPDPELAADGVDGAVRWVRDALQRGHPRPPEIVGPAPSPIERLHGRWRWHFFLRGGQVGSVTRLLRGLLEDYRPPSGDVRVAVDRDPFALL